MTPLIRQALSSPFVKTLIKDAQGFMRLDLSENTFFDGGSFYAEKTFDTGKITDLNIPMPKCVFVAEDKEVDGRIVFTRFATEPDERIFVLCMSLPADPKDGAFVVQPFNYSIRYSEDNQLIGRFEAVGPYPNGEELKRAHAVYALSLLHRFQTMTTSIGYKATPSKKSITNKRRAKKGLPPLKYDWHTIEIGPKATRSESKGGTHASPRQHERRGHWRITKTGKRVWVRNCIVGDPSRGAVFHDYQLTGAVQ